MGCMGAYIQPVRNILGSQYAGKVLVMTAGHIPFGGAQYDAHAPERGIAVLRHVIYRVVIINIVIVVAVQPEADVKGAAHAEKVGYFFGVAECEVRRMVAAEAAACYGYAPDAGFFYGAIQYFMQQHFIIAVVIKCSFCRGYAAVVPAVAVNTVRAIDAHQLLIHKPAHGIYQAAVLAFVIPSHGGWEEDQRVSFITEHQHLEFPSQLGGMPFVIVFRHIIKVTKKALQKVRICLVSGLFYSI